MSTNYSESSRGCTAQTNLKALVSAWPRCSALFKSMEAGCGLRGNWTKAQLSISRSEQGSKLNRKTMERGLEADYESWRTEHTVGGRQSGRYGSCLARVAAGEAGEPHLRRARWRGSFGLSLLSRRVRATVVRSSAQIGPVGFETAQ